LGIQGHDCRAKPHYKKHSGKDKSALIVGRGDAEEDGEGQADEERAPEVPYGWVGVESG